jgi:hypothetical protein
MDSKGQHARQGGGVCHLWRSPDGNFKHTFLKLDFECEPDMYPGIVIVTDVHYQEVFAAAVQNLQRELPALLKRIEGKAFAYWWLEQDMNEAKRILSGLTEHPVFADIK